MILKGVLNPTQAILWFHDCKCHSCLGLIETAMLSAAPGDLSARVRPQTSCMLLGGSFHYALPHFPLSETQEGAVPASSITNTMFLFIRSKERSCGCTFLLCEKRCCMGYLKGLCL